MGIVLSDHIDINNIKFTDRELAIGFLALYGHEPISILNSDEIEELAGHLGVEITLDDNALGVYEKDSKTSMNFNDLFKDFQIRL